MTVAMALLYQAVVVVVQIALALLVLVQQAVTVVMPHQIQSAGQRLLMLVAVEEVVKAVLLEQDRAAVAMVQLVHLLMAAMQKQIVALVVAVLAGVVQTLLEVAMAVAV
jgi:hypothetical protein